MASLLNAAEKIANQTGISPEQLFALAAYHSTSKKQKTTT
jgi:hypothetical protein